MKIFLFVCLCGGVSDAAAQVTNGVGVNGFNYVFAGNPTLNPALTLVRGVTYVFNLNAFGHPFFIKTTMSDGTANAYNQGVVNNGAQAGTLTFAVPTNAPNQLYYNCSTHSAFGMRGALNIIDPPESTPPPTGQVVLITITAAGITMKSLGAQNWNAVPEYSSNLTAWASVPEFTNVLESGTNTTSFGRLDPICGPNVFLRVRNERQ